jgi:excisionase family DNA binding protein
MYRVRISCKPEVSMPTQVTDRLLTTEEVCAFLGIDRRTLERIYAKGEGPKRKKVGGTWRWRQSWLDAWIDEDERASA